MADPPFQYVSDDSDSTRWAQFEFRPGDIVISTRTKCGTTWMQMICALLVFQTPELPAPLPVLSPWLDWRVLPLPGLLASLSLQRHRRFIKTHTPLDGLPLDPRATYIVVARHPLDAAVSLYHQASNLNRELMRELSGLPEPAAPPKPRPPLREWLLSHIEQEADPRAVTDSLQGVMLHMSDAWARRSEPNVVLVHYADLSADLAGQMRRLAGELGIEVPAERWPALVEAATFANMRARGEDLAPAPPGVMRSRIGFFREGRSGAGRDLLTADELVRYHARVAGLAPADLLAWLHRP